MKISLNWLRDYVDTTKSAEDIAHDFTFGGIEVENIEYLGKNLKDIIVGEIIKMEPHTNADRLRITTVALGKIKPLTIVCGASNIVVGQKVPVALPGAHLPNGTVIKESAIRGVTSQGMLCSLKELGLGDDYAGIYILPSDTKRGISLKSVLGMDDTVFDCSITPNRADCLSHIGMAREIAGLAHNPQQVAKIDQIIHKESLIGLQGKNPITDILAVDVKIPKWCPQYRARVIRNVTIQQSPDWLAARLQAVGIRPINVIVDCTNYVMMAYGQPLHAFDLKKIHRVSGMHRIEVRKARKGEKIILLDEKEYTLTDDIVVIADSTGAIAVAGVMGGAESAVTEKTTDIIIESAQFDGVAVRRAGQHIGMRTEALTRFEKGIDWDITSRALDRASRMIAELAGGEIAKGSITVADPKPKIPSITLSHEQLDTFLGIKIPSDQVERLLLSDGCAVSPAPNGFRVVPPSYRHDIVIEEDIIEEVGRLYGFHHLKPTLPIGELRTPLIDSVFIRRNIARKESVVLGYDELIHHAFYSKTHATMCGALLAQHIEIANPLSEDEKYLRTSLIPQLAESLAWALKRFDAVSLFECGAVYRKSAKHELPDETRHWAAVASAKIHSSDMLFQQMKGTVEYIGARIAQVPLEWVGESENQRCRIVYAKRVVAEVGLYQSVPALKSMTPFAYAWIDLDICAENELPHKHFIVPPIYPAIIRDISFRFTIAPEFAILKAIINKISPLIESVDYVSRFESEGSVTITLRIVYRSSDTTLTSEEVAMTEDSIVSMIEKKLKGKIK